MKYGAVKFRTITLITLLSVLVFLFPSCAMATNPFASTHGSCKSIDGTTVIVTIFVDDPYHQWDWNARSEDASSYFRIRERMSTAVNWLTSQAARYHAQAVFYWDWHDLPYLYNWYTSSNNIRDLEYTYAELREYITDNIPLHSIKEYYRADNVLFLALYNQDITDTVRGVSFALDFWEYASDDQAYEILWIMDEDNGLTVSAAGLAHEIMHCFGAVDLYEGSEYTTAPYLKHLKSINSKDIMYTIDYSTPDHIGETFSELDAYYMGLCSYSADRVKFGLKPSSFDK